MALEANWDRLSLHVWGVGEAAGELRAAVGEMSAEPLLASVAEDSSLELWLPSAIVPGHEGEAVSTLMPVKVATLKFSPADAMDLLLSMPLARGDEALTPTLSRSTGRGGNAIGDSIRFFAALAKFVTERLASRQFFPDVIRGNGQAKAAWRLLVGTEEELLRLEQFAESMPASVRAMVGAKEMGLGEADAIVESFLGAAADAIIRRDVANDEFFASVHARAVEPGAGAEVKWMSALLGADRVIKGEGAQIAALAEQVRGWIGKLDEGTAGAAVKVGFRLVEPEEDDDEERVTEEGAPTAEGNSTPQPGPFPQGERGKQCDRNWRLLFQVRADEENVISAEELWKQRADAPGVLGRNVVNRRAMFISELHRAAEAYPELGRALGEMEPVELRLSTLETHLFIRDFAPVLQERGFEVVLPAWVARRERELGLLLQVRPEDEQGDEASGRTRRARSAGLGLDSLLDFDWQIAVGDVKLSLDEFRSLANKSSPLVRYRGQWMQIDEQAAHRAAEFLTKKSKGKMTLAEAFRTAYGATRGEAGLPVVGLVGSSWVKDLLEQGGAKLEALTQPGEFKGTLRPYQQRGLDWLHFLDRLGIGACLADDMGLGKTIQFIALLLNEREGTGDREQGTGKKGGGRLKGLNPTLLFAPTSVVGNWVREIERFAPKLKVLVHHGPERLKGEEFEKAANASDLVITSYALAHRDVADLRRPVWNRMALDEAQKIKNPSAASSLAIRSLSAPRRVALTGTPIENHLSELWSIMEVLNPGLLGSASEFRERFAVPIEKMQDSERAAQLRKMIQPFVLRRSKSDPTIAGDLPEKMEFKVFCNLTPEQAALYERMTGEMLGQIDTASGIRRRGLILAVLTRLKQICDHPALLTIKDGGEAPPLHGRSGKCERLVEMMEEVLEEGDAALIFTQFREMGHLLERILPERLGQPVIFLHGGTPVKKREEMIARFQSPGSDVKIFLLSLKAGGLGLNLTAANHVFHFDRWWNPAVEAQATDRAHRIGQTRKVQVHKLMCVGTVEERIDKLITEKIALADRIVSAGDEWLTDLSTNELKEYLTLSKDAVAEY